MLLTQWPSFSTGCLWYTKKRQLAIYQADRSPAQDEAGYILTRLAVRRKLEVWSKNEVYLLSSLYYLCQLSLVRRKKTNYLFNSTVSGVTDEQVLRLFLNKSLMLSPSIGSGFLAYAVFHHMVFTACHKVVIQVKDWHCWLWQRPTIPYVVIKLVMLLKDACDIDD